jgi:hypothetical protein
VGKRWCDMRKSGEISFDRIVGLSHYRDGGLRLLRILGVRQASITAIIVVHRGSSLSRIPDRAAARGARVLSTRHAIRRQGQPGVRRSGPQEAVSKDPLVLDNGTKRCAPVTPRGRPGRQGPQRFVPGKGGAETRTLG